MASSTDALRAKTDAELQFFVNNPNYYHADLVAAARRELVRRGVGAPTPPPAAQAPYATTAYDAYAAAPSAGRPLLWGALLVLGLGLAGAWWQKRPPAAAPLVARPISPDSLKLEEVETHPLPTFDTDPLVATQVARIPASEKQQAAALRQFRELCRRFWAAETQTEFLTNQAHAGQAGDLFADQALAVRSTWRDWNKAVVYRYDFGPRMQDQFTRMGQVASHQQHILDRLPGLLPGRKFLTDKELTKREAEVQDIMRGVRATSPVTHRPYQALVLEAR